MELGRDLLYLNQEQILGMDITMPTVIDLMEDAYREKGGGRYSMPPKVALHTLPDSHPGDFIHAMPAHLPGMAAAGVKIVSGYVKARELGHPYISGLYLLSDENTGIPLAIMDCVWMTTVRTGAVTGLTAKYLANADSESLGVIGAGVQGRINLDALTCTMPELRTVRVYDDERAAAERYAEEMSSRYPELDVRVEVDRAGAVRDCDLLLSAVPCVVDPEQEFITADMIKPGATALPVDDLALYKPEVAAGGPFTKFYTDDRDQFQHFKDMGFFRGFSELPEELGAVICGDAVGRTDREECIMTVNIGTGLADVALARRLYDLAIQRGLGNILRL